MTADVTHNARLITDMLKDPDWKTRTGPRLTFEVE